MIYERCKSNTNSKSTTPFLLQTLMLLHMLSIDNCPFRAQNTEKESTKKIADKTFTLYNHISFCEATS